MPPIRTTGVIRQAGLSLIEVMVALSIGIVLLLGLVEIFGASRAAFGTAEGVSRVQENARFAVDFMRRDLRMVGHMGCLNERGYIRTGLSPRIYNHSVNPSTNITAAPFALRLDVPFIGYEFNGTAPGQSFDMTAGASTGLGPGSFTPALDPSLGDVVTDAIRGSDMFVVRFLGGEGARSTRINVATNTLQILDITEVPFFEARAIYGVSNCRQVSLFQTQGAGANINVGAGGINAVGWITDEDGYASPATAVYRYEYAVYYVGLDAASGLPSLRMRRLDPNRAGFLSAPQTLVEGVDTMQLIYGVDVGPTRDDVLDQYVTAAGVGALDATQQLAWQRVLNARVSLLMSSPNPAAAVRDDNSPPLRVADTVIQAADDGRVRQVYETVITMRNRVRN